MDKYLACKAPKRLVLFCLYRINKVHVTGGTKPYGPETVRVIIFSLSRRLYDNIYGMIL
jgi:hypothetical protein